MTKKEQKQLDALREERNTLEQEVQSLQIETAQKEYDISLPEGAKTLTSILKILNTGVKWNHKSAPGIVELHDTLNVIKKNQPVKEKITLPAYLMHIFYQSLLAREATGIAAAKHHITLVKHIGNDVGAAMDSIHKNNENVQQLHVKLNELDVKIDELESKEKPNKKAKEAVPA